ncbi:hypothetical protein CSIM01_06794 [Colletotrichum simmondsii]|uniref:Uncharacterized protein n=1 Tax=Colletotrichum simmondsii TaxID=703756 RepID=A0A135RW08_9PEZI|nr:hypothetical protein CSIM01_06794 [Colletotrichum simmondsii]
MNDTERPVRLGNLSGSLRGRFRRIGLMEDLNESIQETEDAISSTPEPKSPQQRSRLTMFKHIEEAVKYLRESLAELSNDDDTGRAVTLDNLATALDDRSQLGSQLADVEESIQLVREALSITSDSHPSRARKLGSLGMMLERKFNRTKKDFRYRDEAKRIFLLALNSANGDIASRVTAGLIYISASSLRTDGCEMYNVAKTLMELIQLWIPLSLKPSDKQYFLSSVVGLSSNAAAISLEIGESPLSAGMKADAHRLIHNSVISEILINGLCHINAQRIVNVPQCSYDMPKTS